jgi:hypothetical protein
MKKVYVFLLIIALSVFLLIGCDGGFTPSPPNDEYDEENTVLDYIKVFPTQTEMNVNQSKEFTMKAYNSEDKLIAVDVSQVKWTCVYECLACGVVWKLSPTQGSLQTTFTPINTEKIGNFKVWANYEGKWANADVEVY